MTLDPPPLRRKRDQVSKFGVLEHFLGNCSLKVSNYLHDGRRQYGASFEYGAIYGENPNMV